MKTIYSESSPDYSNYIFPYVIWGLPDEGECPSEIFNKGFLPSLPDLSRYYMCRNIRIHLDNFSPSSENRRILRKGTGVTFELVERENFDFTAEKCSFFLEYTEKKFGQGVMSEERLNNLFSNPAVSHILVFKEGSKEVGYVLMYIMPNKMAYYYYAFYDLENTNHSLGLFMMTSAIQLIKESGCQHIYLGSVYYKGALYKTNFSGLEFWNGFEWSQDLKQLKFLVERGNKTQTEHLLESKEFIQTYYSGNSFHV